MTTTPPPMPEPKWFDTYIGPQKAFTYEQIEARDAQWMERITALEADISRFHQAMKDAGWHPGRTDDLLTDIIRAKGEAMRNLEADRKMLREALEKLTHYAECQVAAFSSGRPSLDMTLFPRLCADARTALRNTHD